MVVAAGGTRIFIHHNRLVRSIISLSPFVLFKNLFIYFIFPFLLKRKKKFSFGERERPSFSNVCACAVTLAHPRLALNLFMDSALLVPSWFARRLCPGHVSCTNTQEGKWRRGTVWPLLFFPERKKKKVPFKTEMIREQKKEKRKMFERAGRRGTDEGLLYGWNSYSGWVLR